MTRVFKSNKVALKLNDISFRSSVILSGDSFIFYFVLPPVQNKVHSSFSPSWSAIQKALLWLEFVVLSANEFETFPRTSKPD